MSRNINDIQRTLNINDKKICKQIIGDKNSDDLIFECPNCNMFIIVNKHETNCCIFRHAIYKNTYQQVSPHLSKLNCDELLENNLIYGCCKPFYFIKDLNIYNSKIIICDYI